MLPSQRMRRLISTSVSAASISGATPLTAGRKLISSFDFAITPKVALEAWLKIIPFGSGSDNNTFTMKVWLASYGEQTDTSLAPSTKEIDCDLQFAGSAACTLSTGVGVAAGIAVAAERMCDTIVWTMGTESGSTPSPQALSELNWGEGSSFAYSPANNTPGYLVLPHTARASHAIIEFASLSGTTACNALVETGPF